MLQPLLWPLFSDANIFHGEHNSCKVQNQLNHTKFIKKTTIEPTLQTKKNELIWLAIPQKRDCSLDRDDHTGENGKLEQTGWNTSISQVTTHDTHTCLVLKGSLFFFSNLKERLADLGQNKGCLLLCERCSQKEKARCGKATISLKQGGCSTCHDHSHPLDQDTIIHARVICILNVLYACLALQGIGFEWPHTVS